MEFLNNYRQRQQLSKAKNLEREANDRYTITDFKGGLFFAFDGVPIIGIDPKMTAETIIQRLQSFRDKFVAMKESD